MIYNDDAKSYLRKRACVIISWDIKCKGYYSGMYGKPVANLDQPFYNILLDDRFPEYVPEGTFLQLIFSLILLILLFLIGNRETGASSQSRVH